MCHQNSSGSPFSIRILWNLKLPKGQLISKCLFGVLNSSKKGTKTIRPWGIIVVESNFLVRFLEEFKTPKRHFEINWPLLYLGIMYHLWFLMKWKYSWFPSICFVFFPYLNQSKLHFLFFRFKLKKNRLEEELTINKIIPFENCFRK